MPDRIKILRGAECCKYVEPSQNGCPEECPYLPEGHITCGLDPFLDDVIALLNGEGPRVLAVREVERIGADNHGSFKNDGLTVMWLEEFGKQFSLHVVILKWDEDDWQGEPNNIVNVYYFGTDEFDQFNLTDYNKTWRCWTDKPTETQRMGAAWDA